MNAWFRLRESRAVLLSGVALFVAGLVPVLYFLALLVWQISTLFLTGSWVGLPATLVFTEHLHLGLPLALVGLAVAAVGALIALRQLALIRDRKQRDEDRLRRVRDYRREDSRADPLDGRREPFIGSGARNADRRVA